MNPPSPSQPGISLRMKVGRTARAAAGDRSAGLQPAVSQVYNLQKVRRSSGAPGFFGRSADWKSAIQQVANLRYTPAALPGNRRLIPSESGTLVLLVLVLALLPVLLGAADKKPGEAASLKSAEIQGKVQAGAEVKAVLKVALEKGYHTHSHTPSEKQFIPTVLTFSPPAGVKIGKISYPPGKSQKVQGLSKPLSVYEDHFEIAVPITLPAQLKLPLKIPATLAYQACQGALCYPPRKLPLEIVMLEAK